MASGDVVIRWVSESSAAIRDMSRVNKALGDSASRADKWSRRLDTAGTVATGVLAAMVPAAIKVTMAASDQEQALGSLNAVFKNYTGEMEAAAKASYEIGLSTTQYGQMASVLGAQLKNLGLDTKDASTSTQELITLGADLAAQFGGTTADAVAALGSLLRGERDPIEKYGISINEAAIKAKMAEGDMSKLEATMALLNEQAKKSGSLGAAARESDTLAAGLQKVKAQFENLNAAMGKALGGTGKGGALGQLAKQLKDITDWVEANPETFRAITQGIAGISAALVVLKGALAVTAALKTFLAVVTSPWALAAGWVAFDQWLSKMNREKGGIYTLLDWLKDLADFLSNPVGNSIEIAISSLKRTIDGAYNVFRNFRDVLSNIRDTIGSIDLNPFGGRLAPGVNTRITSPTSAAPAAAAPNVNVYVAGERRRSVVRTQPAWAPALTLGVI